MLKILLSMGIVLSTNACASSSHKGECPAVESVKTIPFKDGTGYDDVYERLIRDDACEARLIRALGDTRKMKDPRQAPIDPRFAVSDAAVFIFLRRHQLRVESILPVEVADRLKDQGIFAYFDFVSTPEGRKFVITRVKELARR